MPVLVVVEVPGGSSALDAVLIEAWGLASSPPARNLLRVRLHLSLEDAGAGQPVVSVWEIEKVHRFK